MGARLRARAELRATPTKREGEEQEQSGAKAGAGYQSIPNHRTLYARACVFAIFAVVGRALLAIRAGREVDTRYAAG